MSRKGLTAAQLDALRILAGPYTFGQSGTNLTGAALQRLGLARWVYEDVFVSGVGQWEITPDGRTALAAATGTAETSETSAQCEASQSGGEAVTPNPIRRQTSE